MDESLGYRSKNEIDNLIIAAAAAGGDPHDDSQREAQMYDMSKMSLWRSVSLQPDHAEAIRSSVLILCESHQETNFQPQPYSKKLGTEEDYQEMLELSDFKGDEEYPERVELMRKHSMIFRPTGPQSKALTLFEQAVNEAAAQICFIFPGAIFHKRNLAYIAKTAVKRTGIDFPNANTSRHLLTGLHPESNHGSDDKDLMLIRDPAYHQMNNSQKMRENIVKFSLSPQEYQMIAEAALQKASLIPQFPLKTREQCTLVENYVYTDAVRLTKIDPESLDEEMKYIREVSAIYGRYPSGPRMPSSILTPFEVGMNEAAAWVVRFVPTMLTHRRQLTEWARRVLMASGLNLSQTTQTSQSYPTTQTSVNSSGGHLSPSHHLNHHHHHQLNSQGLSYTDQHYLHHSSDLMDPMNNVGEVRTAAMGIINMPAGLISYYEDEESAISSDNHELVKFLGGTQAIAQLTDNQLEDLGRAQFTVIDPATDNEMANTSMFMSVEEDDRPLDASEILRVTGKSTLQEVTSLVIPCSGYTSINAMDLASCVNLKELDLSENALRVFPRRLHLPRLKKLGLTGNRFFHVPFVEQFPNLIRLTIDEKIRSLMNLQMLIYFCPLIKYINGQYVDEMRSDFTARVIHEAKGFLEPQIRTRWEQEFGDQVFTITSRTHLHQISENIISNVRERNNLMDESINRYKDLILFRLIEDFLRQKFNTEDLHNSLVFCPINEYKKSERITLEGGEELNIENLDQSTTTDEERDIEARAAGEKALFDAADELLGMNLPEMQVSLQNNQGSISSPFNLVHDQLNSNAQGVASLAFPPGYPSFHLGRSLRQGRSVIMTVVKPQGISGRPIAEFLPGELRNKDYVKGYMASEIYKKAVKDTLGQKSSPKKSGKNRRLDSVPNQRTNENNYLKPSTHPLMESNQAEKKFDHSHSSIGEEQLKNLEMNSGLLEETEEYENSATTIGLAPVPPRPKKRKPASGHNMKTSQSLRDLCTETPTAQDPQLNANKIDSSLIDYDPLHFIRCHAKDNDAGDSETKVWRCLFEPNPLRPDETTHIVATCGGECVCLINCESGKVLKRFKLVDEEFYTIAWTTVEVESGIRANILAAAGKMKEIRLLHPELLVCYAEMKGHTEDVTAMIFHQTQSTVLFSGDSKASVLVWDIGVPTVPNYKTNYQLLMRLRCPRLDVNPVLNLVFLPHYAYLIAGCEDGLFAWKISELRLEKREREPDMELKIEAEHEVCIDALSQLSDNALVIKVVESGEISVFDFASVLERRKGLQRVVPLEMRGHLSWQKTDEIYINVSVRQNLGAVLCGDNEGSIWIYDLDPHLDDLHASSRKKFFVKPIRILEWPECSVQGNRDEDQQLKESISSGFRNPVVNSVEMSSDGKYLAAVTDNNLVCIWRYSPSNSQTSTAYDPTAASTSQQPLRSDGGVYVNAV